jgi:hypothetical protein
MKYPLFAHSTGVQGVVVVRAASDGQGRVVSVDALSGAKALITDSLANAAKWQFRPSSPRVVIIVYEFRIEGLCGQECGGQFVYKPPNVAVITAGAMVIDHG